MEEEERMSLAELVQMMPASSVSRRQFALVRQALDGLEGLQKKNRLDETGKTVICLLRAATDAMGKVIRYDPSHNRRTR